MVTVNNQINSDEVHDYRSRWQPIKDRLSVDDSVQNSTRIRFHRACSWLQAASELDINRQPDEVLVLTWVAFNSLYGTWNVEDQCPDPDVASWQHFIGRMVKLDQDDVFASMIGKNKGLIDKLLNDEHLSKYFWEDPTDERAGKSRKAMYNARTWRVEKNWIMVLIVVLERVYMMRCQLTHGAATKGSRLNRDALDYCIIMMSHAMRCVMEVWIAAAEHEDWGAMCYPPMG